MLLEERDELAHLGLVRRELARVLGDLDEAIAIARFLDFRKEKIQLDEVEMLDLVRAALDELRADMNAGTWPLTRRPRACARSAMIGTSSGLIEE